MVDDLQEEMISHIKNTEIENVRTFLSKAIDYAINDLILYSTDLIRKGDYYFGTLTFYKMSPLAVEYLLKLRLDTTESEILEALVCWMRENTEYSSLFPKLLKHIDLYLLDEPHLDTLFEPDELIDRAFVQNLLFQQQEEAKIVRKIVNQNVIDNPRIIEGMKEWKEWSNKISILSSAGENNITIDLKQKYLLNCIKLNIEFDMFYTVSVSKDTRDWERVIDHSKYKCSRQQVLYFEERAFRFIRIHCRSSIDTIEALYSTDTFEIDPETNLIVPDQNVVSTKLTA